MKSLNLHLRSIVLFACTVSLAHQVFAADPVFLSGGLKQLPSLPKGASIYRLDNGLQVLLIENPALPVVGANVIVRVGSAYESFSTSGSSHMLEHLLFNGTTTRSQKQLYDDVDRIGGYNNASTDDFFTNYMFVVPVENARKGLSIQADMLFNSTLPVENFQKERGIVLEEISKSIADPAEQLERNTIAILYGGHALSLPTLGTYATIESLTRDEVYGFYKSNYVPNNMLLTVIGNFQTATMLPVIKELYGKARPGEVVRISNPDWKTGFESSGIDPIASGAVYHRFYDGNDKVLQLFFRLPAGQTPEYSQLINLVLGKGKDRIESALRSQYPGITTVGLHTRESHLGNYLEAKVTFVGDQQMSGVADSLSAMVADLTFALPVETVEAEATKGRTEFARNLEKPHMFGIYYSALLVKNGIESFFASYNGDGYFAAAGELVELALPAYRFAIVQTPTPKAGKGKNEAATVTKFYSDTTSGKNLIVVQNEANNLLAVHFLVKHKAAYESRYGKDAAKILHETIGQRLTSDANRKSSGKFGLSLTVNDNPYIPMDDIYLHPDFGYIRVEGLADDVVGAIRFVTRQLRAFAPTEEEFRKAVEKYRGIDASLAGGDKGKKLFEETYRAEVFEPNPLVQQQQPLTYDRLLAFAGEYFAPSNIIISVVSPARPDTVEAAFAGFGFSRAAHEPPVYAPSFRLADKPVRIEKNNGGERSYLFWGFSHVIDSADAPALQALSLILSERIVFDIREKQGLAYNIGAGIDIAGNRALFFVNQGSRPKNVDTLVAQYPRFFRQSVVDSLTDGQLEKSVNQYLGRIIFRRLSSINKAFYLGTSLYFEKDYTYDKKSLDRLSNVKVADVRAVARKYLRVTNPISVIIR